MAGVHGDPTSGNEARFLHPRQFIALEKVLKWRAARELVLGQPENVQIPEIGASFIPRGEFL